MAERFSTVRQWYKMCLCILIILLLTACKTANDDEFTIPEEGHTLNWNINYMPRRFYPSMMLTDEEKQIVNNLYEGLTRLSEDKIVNGIADSISMSEDGLSYEVVLKKAQWSDGKLVTTDDFIYSWERSMNYAKDLNLLYYDAYIDRVEVIDEKTMIIHLYHVNDNLLYQLSMVAFMPVRRDVIDLNKAIPTFISDVTNGPYYLGSYRLFGGITLNKNKHYYDYYEVKIDQIQVYLNNNFNSSYQNYKNGTIDFMQGVDLTHLASLIQNEDDFKIHEKPGIYSFAINSSHDELSDVRIRRALNIAIDRTAVNPFEGIIDDSLMFSMIDYDDIEDLNEIDENTVAGYYMVMKPYAQMDKINGIIAALGSGQLESLNGLRVVTRNTPNDVAIANLLIAGWQEYLDVKLVVVPKDRYDYAYALKTKNYDIILNNHYYLEDNIRYTLKHFIGETKLNTSEFSSETFDENLMSTYKEKDSHLYQIFKSSTDELDASSKMIPLFKIYEALVISSNIEGWTKSYEDLFYFGRASKTIQDKEDEILE